MPDGYLRTSVDKCTGCHMCTLACSRLQTDGFNPRYAKIQICQELSGYVTAIEFTGGCNNEIPHQCLEEGVNPRCVMYCLFDAITYKRREENGRDSTN